MLSGKEGEVVTRSFSIDNIVDDEVEGNGVYADDEDEAEETRGALPEV
jgi:hypothetical protein